MGILELVEDDNLAVENKVSVLAKNGVLVRVVPADRISKFKPECWQQSGDPKGHGHLGKTTQFKTCRI
jgi:hypothetical protein